MREFFMVRPKGDKSDSSKQGPDRTPAGGGGAGGDSGIARAWYIWLRGIFDAIIGALNAITGLTITTSTQANLAALGPSLQPNSLVFVSDFNHQLEWTGTMFTWGPGDSGSGYISGFLETPGATGWQLCDGSTTTRLNGDGTVTAVTVPNYTTPSYLKFATVADIGPHAPGGTTGNTSGGTPTGTIAVGNNDASTTVQAGVGAVVAANPHQHPALFTGNLLPVHDHAAGSVELERTTLKAYFRR